MAEMDKETFEHLATVVEHFIHDEQRHYESMVEDGEPAEDHIFLDLAAVQSWLKAQPEYAA